MARSEHALLVCCADCRAWLVERRLRWARRARSRRRRWRGGRRAHHPRGRGTLDQRTFQQQRDHQHRPRQRLSWETAIDHARACSPLDPVIQCDASVVLLDQCGCASIVVNENHVSEIQEAQAAYDAWVAAGCGPYLCESCSEALGGWCPGPRRRREGPLRESVLLNVRRKLAHLVRFLAPVMRDDSVPTRAPR